MTEPRPSSLLFVPLRCSPGVSHASTVLLFAVSSSVSGTGSALVPSLLRVVPSSRTLEVVLAWGMRYSDWLPWEPAIGVQIRRHSVLRVQKSVR